MFIRIALLMVMLIISMSSHAWTSPSKKEEMVDRVLTLSGTKTAMRYVSSQIARGFHSAREMSDLRMSRQEMTPEQRKSLEHLLKVMRGSFDHDAMLKTAAAYLADNTTEKQLAAAIGHLSKKEVRRIIGLEIKAMNSASKNVLNDFAHALQIRKPSPLRMTIVDHIDRITEASRHSADLAMEIFGAFFQSNPAHMERLRAIINKQARDQTILTLLYAYRNLTDRELQEYALIYQDEDYAWVARMTVRGVNVAIKHAFDEFKGSLVEWVTNEMETAGRRSF